MKCNAGEVFLIVFLLIHLRCKDRHRVLGVEKGFSGKTLLNSDQPRFLIVFLLMVQGLGCRVSGLAFRV